jgi:hypothetical protein
MAWTARGKQIRAGGSGDGGCFGAVWSTSESQQPDLQCTRAGVPVRECRLVAAAASAGVRTTATDVVDTARWSGLSERTTSRKQRGCAAVVEPDSPPDSFLRISTISLVQALACGRRIFTCSAHACICVHALQLARARNCARSRNESNYHARNQTRIACGLYAVSTRNCCYVYGGLMRGVERMMRARVI